MERIFGYIVIVYATMLGLTIHKLVIADSTLVLVEVFLTVLVLTIRRLVVVDSDTV